MLRCACATQGNRSAEAGRRLAGDPCISTFYHQRQSFSQRVHHRGSVRCILESAGRRLLVVVISLVVDDVEELELVHSLRGGDDTEPVTELHLLEELLGPSVRNITVSMLPPTYPSCKLSIWMDVPYRYLRYRPDSSLWAMISILPSPTWEIWMVSPRLPTRPSTLIFSFRNFSKAETSKILSLAGCEALMMNCIREDVCQRCARGWELEGSIWRDVAYLLGGLGGPALLLRF